MVHLDHTVNVGPEELGAPREDLLLLARHRPHVNSTTFKKVVHGRSPVRAAKQATSSAE